MVQTNTHNRSVTLCNKCLGMEKLANSHIEYISTGCIELGDCERCSKPRYVVPYNVIEKSEEAEGLL